MQSQEPLSYDPEINPAVLHSKDTRRIREWTSAAKLGHSVRGLTFITAATVLRSSLSNSKLSKQMFAVCVFLLVLDIDMLVGGCG